MDISKDGGSKPNLFVKLRILPIFVHIGEPRGTCDQSSNLFLISNDDQSSNHPILIVEDAFLQASHPFPWLIGLLLLLAVKNCLYLVNLVMIGIFCTSVSFFSLYLDANLKFILAKSVICRFVSNITFDYWANFAFKELHSVCNSTPEIWIFSAC